ncbi:MAG: RNA polymerase factor sigma-54 [Deltaproteobacteria bacterium]|nr:RNA polymerase factor sigma-54 [Deltaproteobacteria bacterium]MBZ0218838.1 RNA polymerase factor sigma-54 [Deltaproteobacteria bacterium]
MAYELKQELRLTQNLVMTPQLQLAIKLLQLSRLELVEMVREEVETNPVLEDLSGPEVEAGGQEAPPEKPEKPEMDWEAYIEEQSQYRSGGIDFSEREEEDDFVSNLSEAGGSLSEHLLWQLRMQGLPDADFAVGDFIIGNIDEDGYLRVIERGQMQDDEYEAATIAEVANATGTALEDASRVLATIQQFDPLGAGSRTLRECLMVQARSLPVRDTVMEEVISCHLEKLAKKNFKAIAKALGVEVEEVLEAARTISRCLNPMPGAGFGKDESRAVLPDIFIQKVGDEYVISLNEDGMPKLKISPYYRELLKAGGASADQAKGYIQDKLRSAMWLIKSVHQRQRTIYKVVECIVKFQREFLDKGLKHLKPLVLKDVAVEIGMHESTVSRVTSNKYVQTPRGIFELKYFFSNGIAGDGGEAVAVEYIKEKVRKIIESEDPKAPLSDKQIVEALKESGIMVARRTATKYREALGFQSSNRRKVHF